MGTVALISKHDHHGVEAKPLVMRSEKQSEVDEIHIDSVGQQAKVHPGSSHVVETSPEMLVATGHKDVTRTHMSAKKQAAEKKQVAKKTEKSSKTNSKVAAKSGSSDDPETLEETTTTTLAPLECINGTGYKRCLVQQDHECGSPDKNMTENATTVEDCAAKVFKNSGKFFCLGVAPMTEHARKSFQRRRCKIASQTKTLHRAARRHGREANSITGSSCQMRLRRKRIRMAHFALPAWCPSWLH